MDRFLQLHMLTSYPPSNLNRDDLGRPKTAVMGGATRLRVSSQSLKRAWRTSDVFASGLKGHVGTRTKEMGRKVANVLLEKGVDERKAREWARSIAGVFGKLKHENKDNGSDEALEIEQLAHFSPAEQAAVMKLAENAGARSSAPTVDELELLQEKTTAADIALFGRMLAASPRFNFDAAAQVAHAITTHTVAVEDDFFTAVDDLNQGDVDRGAGHMGETEYGAGLYYLYVCVDRTLLMNNLDGDAELVTKSLQALVETAATVAPGGKQNSFGSRARASYVLAETGDEQPRSLSVAFLEPITGQNMLRDSIERLRTVRANMDKVYGQCWSAMAELDADTGDGSLAGVIGRASA